VIAVTHKILVVEDDKHIALALAVRLRAAGYDVVSAPDAILAVSMALKHRPDQVLLDLLMPGGNGFLVAERIQDLEAMLGVPCIFLTVSKQPGLREQARRLGAAGFFEKPYDTAELLATIREVLEVPADERDLPDSPIRTWIIDEATDPTSAEISGTALDHVPAPPPWWKHRIAWAD
jgi:DNA-binding response OmpR family regulator